MEYNIYIYIRIQFRIPLRVKIMKTVKVTKIAVQSYVKNMLGTNKGWAQKALLRIYAHQTEDEQKHESTEDMNGVGFTGVDGEILSSFSSQLIRRGSLSDKQMAIVYQKMPKYWNQIIMLSDQEALLQLVKKSLNIE